VQQQVWTLDPEQPLASVETLDETLSTNVADRRFNTLLLASLALLALALALVGCYGVVSYAAAQRTREIGIRMAFGADRSSVVGLIVKNGMRWSILGVVAGVSSAIGLARVMRGLLFEVRPVDPWTFAAVAAATAGVSLLASYLPARRAARVEPSAALRVN
jgi:putative ABC transport system permease protein